MLPPSSGSNNEPSKKSACMKQVARRAMDHMSKNRILHGYQCSEEPDASIFISTLKTKLDIPSKHWLPPI
jgi:hypothetical protein